MNNAAALLVLIFLPLGLANADLGYTTYVSTVYQLSCERTVLRMYTKYGAGKLDPPAQEKMPVRYCSENIENIDKAKAWKDIDSPAGTACMDVVKSLIKVAPKRYPSKDELFSELCYAITKRDG